MTQKALKQDRQNSNPLYSNHRMKLGVMAFNCSHGSAITTVEEAWQQNWPDTKDIAIMSDKAGFEVLLPVGRWRGYGGVSNFNNATYESFTWASSIGAITDNIGVFATCHVPLVNPVMAAKMATTVDHVTSGRFCLNVVCGWFRDEFDMFGAEWRLHDERYEYGAEWVDFVRRLWSEQKEFDFNGTFFKSKRAWSQPKPLQSPFPPIMNAGGSEAGQEFASTIADMNFAVLKSHDLETGKNQVDKLKKRANEVGRKIQVWIHVYVVCRETEKEAREYLNHYVVEKGDYVAVNNLMEIFGVQAQSLPKEALEQFQFHFIAGHGGYPLVGTPEQIVDGLEVLSNMGIDGCLISWVNYKDELRQWIDDVLPLMEQAGQREFRKE